jgi:hypothetical protein
MKASMYEKTQKAIKHGMGTNAQNINQRKIGTMDWTEVQRPAYGKFDFLRYDKIPAKCQREHQADVLRADYIDGVFITYCRDCDIKLVLEKVPGQFPKLKIMGLLSDVMLGEPVDPGEVLEVRAALQKERELLERAESDYRLMMSIIGNQYEDKEGIPVLPEV